MAKSSEKDFYFQFLALWSSISEEREVFDIDDCRPMLSQNIAGKAKLLSMWIFLKSAYFEELTESHSKNKGLFLPWTDQSPFQFPIKVILPSVICWNPIIIVRSILSMTFVIKCLTKMTMKWFNICMNKMRILVMFLRKLKSKADTKLQTSDGTNFWWITTEFLRQWHQMELHQVFDRQKWHPVERLPPTTPLNMASTIDELLERCIHSQSAFLITWTIKSTHSPRIIFHQILLTNVKID